MPLTRRRVRSAHNYGGATTIVFDQFTRADSAVSLGSTPQGQAWVQLIGLWGINGNQAYRVDSTADTVAYVETSKTNVDVSVTLATLGPMGLAVRVVDATHHWRIVIDSGNLYVQKKNGGSYVTVINPAMTAVAGDIIRVVVVGDDWVIRYNGTIVTGGSFTDAANNTGTKHGLAGSVGSPVPRYDNFTVIG